ncbi:MAG: hypothetical protein MOGMAGMI_01802 [Candidatus Omnitrophica bacterium]|nr:hypothetical protein [Candidatus Omnitrophota bacterium]
MSHYFKRMIWTPPTPVGKDRFHCDKCDSTVQFDSRLSEHEVNRIIAHDIKRKFPCVDFSDEDYTDDPISEMKEVKEQVIKTN